MKDQVEQLLYLPDSKPFGVSLPNWTARWWNWLHSTSKESNPAADATGKFSDVLQLDQNVWFLAGTLGGSAVRRCRISHKKAILFPIITSAFSYAVDPNLKTENELTTATKQDIDSANKLRLSLNDIAVNGLERFRIRTQPFRDVIDGVSTIAVSDGYWIFLKPLKVKQFKIYFSGQNIDFFNEVTYYLSIY